MPWFALDDGFDTHPKVRKAGNAAIGVFCRLGAHAAKHLTEGKLDGSIVRDYGTPATIRKLVTVGMLHPYGHDCARCEQPPEGGYILHDFLDYNRSRKQIEAARESGRKRQQKGRDRGRGERSARDSDAKLASNSRENGASFDSESLENEDLLQGSDAGQRDVSRRDTLQGATGVPSHPSPPSPSEKEKEEGQLATRACSDEPPRIGDRPRIPAASQPLVDALGAAGLLGIGWDLSAADWFLIEALIRRCGLPALVASATASWQGARTRPRTGRYFLPGWRSLPDAPSPAAPGVGRLPAVRGGEVVALGKSRQQQETDDWADRAMTRARARMQQKETS